MAHTPTRRQILPAMGSIFGLPLLSAQAEEGDSPAPRKPKIVVTGGHPGDPEAACGGTIARYSDLGHYITLLYLNKGDPSATASHPSSTVRVEEAKKACEILKGKPLFADQIDAHAIVDVDHYASFRKLLLDEHPDIVFTHWPIDNHADHRAMFNLVYDAWVKSKHAFALFYYEVSNGEDTMQFSPTHYVDISATESRKRQACDAHASQRPEKFYALQATITRMRGIESGHQHAEAFIRAIQSPPMELP